jgi:hypothetical protein
MTTKEASMEERKFVHGNTAYYLVARGEPTTLKNALDLIQQLLVTSAFPLIGLVEVEGAVVTIRAMNQELQTL